MDGSAAARARLPRNCKLAYEGLEFGEHTEYVAVQLLQVVQQFRRFDHGRNACTKQHWFHLSILLIESWKRACVTITLQKRQKSEVQYLSVASKLSSCDSLASVQDRFGYWSLFSSCRWRRK